MGTIIRRVTVCELRKRLAHQYGVSERTLRRYVNAYNANRFEGLKPAERVRYCKNAMPNEGEKVLEKILAGTKIMVVRGATGRKIPHSRVYEGEYLLNIKAIWMIG